jgi:transcription initiation factor TFIIF subunit alpha
VVAKRATSPKAPKAMVNVGSRGSSPLNVSQAATPLAGSRATSPAVGSRAGSPGQVSSNGSQKVNNKRKATEDLAGGSVASSGTAAAVPKLKKRKSTAPSGTAPGGELEDSMVVEWLRTTPSATTRDCIQHFTPYLTDEAKKSKFTALVKEVAQLKGGVLVLRNAYRSPAVVGSSTSPVP